MSDRSPFDPPTGEDTISRLLAEARADEPMPTDVAARLDDVLAGLSAERATAEVVPLVRRRRPARLLLAAAAAVVVAGGGAVTVQQLNGQGSDASTAGLATADREAAGDSGGSTAALKAPSPPSAAEQDAAKSYDAELDGAQLKDTLSDLPTLSTRNFARDARTLLATKSPAPATGAARAPAARCVPPEPVERQAGAAPTASAASRLLPVRVDDRPAWLLVQPAEGSPGSSLVAAWSCNGLTELARTVVPEK